VTNHTGLFAALAAPFAKGEVKSRPQGKVKLRYITARTAMNRLDEVLGPENWWDAYRAEENSVVCTLSVRLPDGQVLTKCDAGGYAGMSDQGDDDKSGYSDAFKRACVKFGIGRYLYRDGVPPFVRAALGIDPGPAPAAPEASPPPPADFPRKVQAPAKAQTFRQFFHQELARVEKVLRAEMDREGTEATLRKQWSVWDTDGVLYLRAVNELVSAAIADGKIKPERVARDGKPDKRDPAKAKAVADLILANCPRLTRSVIGEYLDEKLALAREAVGIPDVEGEAAALDRAHESTPAPANGHAPAH
jgi:hypothetical protein